MIGNYFFIFFIANALLIYVLRLISHLTNGRFLSGWKLVSNPPSKTDLALCYLAMIFLLYEIIAHRLGWM